jgi:hypothetical protein
VFLLTDAAGLTLLSGLALAAQRACTAAEYRRLAARKNLAHAASRRGKGRLSCCEVITGR